MRLINSHCKSPSYHYPPQQGDAAGGWGGKHPS